MLIIAIHRSVPLHCLHTQLRPRVADKNGRFRGHIKMRIIWRMRAGFARVTAGRPTSKRLRKDTSRFKNREKAITSDGIYLKAKR